MIINGLKTINIDGRDCWTVKDFSKLTNRSEYTIRRLIKKGNRLERLKVHKIGNSLYIYAEELFNYKFTARGRPHALGDCFNLFYLENGELHSIERGQGSTR